jgi:hypothetical protein
MYSTGLLSIAFALGTVFGILVLLYGIWRRSRVFRLAGGMGFVISFLGLIFLISKYGAHTQTAAPQNVDSLSKDVTYLLVRWQQADTNGLMTDALGIWAPPVEITISGDYLRFKDNANHAFERSILQEENQWSISAGPLSQAPLQGVFEVNTMANELYLTKTEGAATESLYLIRKAE